MEANSVNYVTYVFFSTWCILCYIFFCEKGRLEKPAALFKYKRKEGKKKDETEMETV